VTNAIDRGQRIMREIRYSNGRVETWEDVDPQVFTEAERAAHAAIYRETGSPIAAWLAGLATEPRGES
jgi:hypothetical protein